MIYRCWRHRCIVWRIRSDFAETLTKGAHVQIKGEIRTREYTKERHEAHRQIFFYYVSAERLVILNIPAQNTATAVTNEPPAAIARASMQFRARGRLSCSEARRGFLWLMRYRHQEQYSKEAVQACHRTPPPSQTKGSFLSHE